MVHFVFSKRRAAKQFLVIGFLAAFQLLTNISLTRKAILQQSSSRSKSIIEEIEALIDKPYNLLDAGRFPADKASNASEAAVVTQQTPSSSSSSHVADDDEDNYDDHILSQHNKTLALMYPIGLTGGYRNQVIRFISFVKYAKNNNITQLLLPSIIWSTTHTAANNVRRFFPAPFELLFDIDHWNTFSKDLPALVDTIPDAPSGNCWNQHNPKHLELYNQKKRGKKGKNFISPLSHKVLKDNALITPLVNYTREMLAEDRFLDNAAKFNLYEKIKACTNPYVYGDAYTKPGRLWQEYTHMPKEGLDYFKRSPDAKANTQFISIVNQALIPNVKWRNVANQCIQQHLPSLQILSPSEAEVKKDNENNNNNNNGLHRSTETLQNYVAVHARVETDMMEHRCGMYMQKNLTTIFSMIDNFVDGYNKEKANSNDDDDTKLEGVFLALSKERMQGHVSQPEFQELAKQNWDALMERSITENPNRKPSAEKGDETTIFQCGELWADKWYTTLQHQEQQFPIVPNDYYGSILPSILDFYIATHAKIFVGVEGSSWSTDVWNTRYYQGNGAGNYEYTMSKIIPLPNGGLPSPHKGCKEIQQAKE